MRQAPVSEFCMDHDRILAAFVDSWGYRIDLHRIEEPVTRFLMINDIV